MLLIGITVALAGRLPGWRRYVPLAVGLWLPVTILMGTLPDQIGVSKPTALPYTMLLSGIYATVGWGLLAYVIRSNYRTGRSGGKEQPQRRPDATQNVPLLSD